MKKSVETKHANNTDVQPIAKKLKSVAIEIDESAKFEESKKSIEDVQVKCESLEMENNQFYSILENISIRDHVYGPELAKYIFDVIRFGYDENTLEEAKVYNMKNGKKRLILKFHSKKVRTEFMDFFSSFGYIRNYDMGLNDYSYIYLKEKLTGYNFKIYKFTNDLLKRGIIRDFLTHSGRVFILPKSMHSYDWNNYVEICDIEMLTQFRSTGHD